MFFSQARRFWRQALYAGSQFFAENRGGRHKHSQMGGEQVLSPNCGKKLAGRRNSPNFEKQLWPDEDPQFPPRSLIPQTDLAVVSPRNCGKNCEFMTPNKEKRTMPISRNYPATVAEVLQPTMKFKRGTVPAVMNFKRTRPWRGSLAERKAKFGRFHQELCRVHSKSTALRFRLLDGGSSGNSHFIPSQDKITLVGKLSVVTYLHEFAHAIGKDERGACRWSINLFARCFPRQFAKCRTEGHMLKAARTSSGSRSAGKTESNQAKIVKVYVDGGVVQGVDVPENVVVKIVDYDVDDEEPSDADEEGRPCNIATWEHDGSQQGPGG
jgi:hypothetical protein